MKTMKQRISILAVLVCVAIQLGAQNNWIVYGGGSMSHVCEKPVVGSDKTYGWGGGFFLGAGYELNFNKHWSLTPQLELSYMNNGAKLSSPELTMFQRNASWLDMWSVTLPVMAGYRFKLTDHVGLKVSAGPYIQESFAIRQYAQDGQAKESAPRRSSAQFNVGAMGELAVETGDHLSYMFRANYPFLKESWNSKTLTLSLGVRYSF